MTKKKRLILAATGMAGFVALLALFCAWGYPPKPALSHVEPLEKEYRLGELIPVVFYLKLPWADDPEAVTCRAAAAAPGLQPAGVERHFSGIGWGSFTWQFTWNYQAFEPGRRRLPAITCTAADGTVMTVTIPEVAIKALLAENESPKLATAPALEAEPSHTGLWLGLGLGLLILAGLAGGIFWKLRPKPEPAPSPEELAETALARLEVALPLAAAAFYQELSDVIRRYLEQAWALPASERATAEFLRELERNNQALDPELRELLSTFLHESDLAKFARAEPSSKQMRAALAAAGGFVRRSAELLEQEPVADSVS